MDGQINAGVNELLNVSSTVSKFLFIYKRFVSIQISAYVDLTELSIGVKEDIIRCDSCCMDSDRYITLRSSCTLHENALTNGSEVAIVDIARKTTSTRRYGLIHEARMNPTLPVIALRAGQKLQLFNIELNSKIKSFEMPVPVEFLKWTSADHLALVTARAVFHWSVENDTEPVKVFDRAEPMLTGRVADYLVSNDCKYCILIALSLGVKTSGNQRPINGLMQLHSTETGASRLLHGLSAVFATLNTTASNSSILCFEGKKSHASAMLVLMTIETTKGFDWRSQKHQIPSHTDYDFDFPVAMIVFRKNDMLYMVSDMGYLYVFDGTTAKPIYYVRVTPDKIFTACGHLSSGGLLYISPCKGRVRLVTLNEVVVVHYVMNTLGDKELAGQLASRFGVVLDDSRAVQAIDDGIQRSDAQPLSPKSNAKRVLLTYAYAPPLPGHMNSNDETNYAMVCRLLQHEMDARKELDIKVS